MNTMPQQTIAIKHRSEGETLGVAGGNYRIVISGQETQGAYAVIEMHVAPGGGPPPHAHPDIQEMFYVLDGAFEFKTEAGKETVTTGGFVNIPFGGAIHCFKNISDKHGKLLCTVVPSGLENYFKALAPPVEPGQFLPVPEPTPERLALLEEMDRKFNQKTYPRNFLDRS